MNLGRPVPVFKTFGRFPTRKCDDSRPSSREARSRRTRAPAFGGGDRVTPAATLRLRGARGAADVGFSSQRFGVGNAAGEALDELANFHPGRVVKQRGERILDGRPRRIGTIEHRRRFHGVMTNHLYVFRRR